MFFNIWHSNKGRFALKITAVIMSFVIFGLLTGAVVDIQSKQIILVTVDAFSGTENISSITTRQDFVSDFIEENNLQVGEYDKISMLPEDKLYDGARLIVRKGRNFTLNIDGNMEFITTTKKTVREAFEEAGVYIGEADKVQPSLDSDVTEDLNVTVVRVVESTVTVDTEIPFTSSEVSDSSLEKGLARVKVQGENGLRRTTYSVTTEDGVEVNRVLLSEEVVKEPKARVVSVGTKPKAVSSGTVTTASGKSLNYSRKITVSATAYTSNGGRTASGKIAQYGVIAVDPKVIPLGTKLYVESTDDGKSWTYGYCIAGDTGGAIKGNKIDLFYNSRSECIQFGRRSAIVYVLN